MFKIERTRPTDPDAWEDLECSRAIDKARAALLVPGDVVTVTDATTGETRWMGVFGRDGHRHEWTGEEPNEVRIAPLLAAAA